jgi:CBS domain-containing protein
MSRHDGGVAALVIHCVGRRRSPRHVGADTMFVAQIMPQARERLAVVDLGAFVSEAAEMMASPHMDLVVVCNQGVMAGIVTKTDIVMLFGRRPIKSWFEERVDALMTREVVSCAEPDPVLKVCRVMCERGVQRLPVLDSAGRPTGIIYARDVLQALLSEAEIEDEMLRRYIAGIGYH